MKLSIKSLEEKLFWKEKGIVLPEFDIVKATRNSLENPKWVHFGAGNIFKAFISNRYQDLLDKGLADTGIVAVESFDFEVIDKIYNPYENLSLLVLTKADGSDEKRIIASVTDSLTTKEERLGNIFLNPELQIASFTITEKGYGLYNQAGEFLDIVKSDIQKGPENPIHVMSIVASMLYKRFVNGAHPLTLLSLDNCSHNGDKLKSSVLTIGESWKNNGYITSDFIDYIKSKVSFPLSMIDKITPRPAETVKSQLESLGIEDMGIVVTGKGTYMAPFVNAEICEYLVIEDNFVNGRPKFENAGFMMTTRDTVNAVETMKVTTCLNPLHTALAVTGCLLGYTLIADEMKNPLLRKMVETIGYKEGLKVVKDPGILDPKKFIDEVIEERLSNSSIPDTPQRIATDTSQKVGIRYGETIKSYIASPTLSAADLTAIPLAIAAWLRYLNGVDDKGNSFTPSPDPELSNLQEKISEKDGFKGILSNSKIFGVDLYSCELGSKIEEMYKKMLQGPGSVEKTLEEYLS